MKILEWKRMPTGWIDHDTLHTLRWNNDGSTNSAALMLYIALCIHASPYDDPVQALKTGEASPTYIELMRFCGLSRAKVSDGLKLLVAINRISKRRNGVNTVYAIKGLEEQSNCRWGKVPFKSLSRKGVLSPLFDKMSIRNKGTLHALKIFLMAVKFRDNQTNYAQFSYDKIEEFAGIPKFEIKKALSALSENNLLVIDSIRSQSNEYRKNIYRVAGVNNTRHLGTMSDENFSYLTDD